MRKDRKIFSCPEELDTWLKENADEKMSQADLIIQALRIFSEMDGQSLNSVAKELGLTPGRMVDVAVKHFSELPPEEQDERISKYYGMLRRKAEKEK